MRTHLLLFISLCLLIITPATAQDDESPEYALRVPTAEEYLEVIPDILGMMRQQNTDENRENYLSMWEIVRREIQTRYSDFSDIPFQLLYDAYQIIQPMNDSFQPDDEWNSLLINAWLRENPTDFDDVNQLEFEDYVINVTQVDFNYDGQNEWVLEIDSGTYSAYWIFQQDASTVTGYRRIDAPLSSYSAFCFYQSGCGGGSQLLNIIDVDTDNLPELIYSSGNCGYGRCAVGLQVLGWRDGALVDLMPTDSSSKPFYEQGSGGGDTPVTAPDGVWTFTNRDDDIEYEFVERIERIDGRGCAWARVRIYDWSEAEDQYLLTEDFDEFTDSGGCAMRQAHFTMLDLDFETSVMLYEDALALIPQNGSELQQEMRQYAQLRLAVAYAFVGQENEAMTLLDELQVDETLPSILFEMVIRASLNYGYTRNPIVFCVALYDEISSYEYYFDTESQIFTYGQINDVAVSMNYASDADFGANTTGCNLEGLWENTLADLNTDGTDNPFDYISEVGWVIDEQRSFDLNDDGRMDWLISVDLLDTKPTFLISTPDGYETRQFQPYLMNPVNYDYLLLDLPNGESAIAVLILSEATFADCSVPSLPPMGELSIWQWVDTRLERINTLEICDEVELSDLIINSNEIIAWDFDNEAYSQSDEGYVQLIFSWDDELQRYVSPLPPPTTQTFSPEPLDVDNDFSGGYGASFCGYILDNAEAIVVIQDMLQNPPEGYDDVLFLTEIRYWLAVLLEIENRPDEALAEYIMIYESAPESAWGMLAGLHLEVVE